MRSSKRRIDYSMFNSTGEKFIQSADMSNCDSKNDTPLEDAEIQTLSEDITDFMDENPIEFLTNVNEVNEAVARIEHLRTAFRHLNHQSSGKLEHTEQMNNIKQYIKDAKERRRNIIGADREASSYVTNKTVIFTIKMVEQSLSNLESKTSKNIESVTDEELSEISKFDFSKTIEKITHQLKDLIKEAAGTVQEPDVDRIQQRYERTRRSTAGYQSRVKDELSSRDISKHLTFKESILKIKLSKFGGFNSKTDIYTFQNDFEKLHLRNTPRCYLPDLLRNNYLEDPALSMVRGENNIDNIWRRLQSSYGDTKILLNNKLSELSKIEHVSKCKNQTKIAESLGKIISTMKDLMTMTRKHDIEAKLYHGDSIQRIYKLIGDSRTTRWLQQICDEDLDGEELWTKLITYLEKEMKIHHQKQLINNQLEADKGSRSYISHHSPNKANDDEPLKCHFCDSTDHVPTSGPQGIKLIQYFVCKKFVEMTPEQRLTELKRRNLCHQCLFPGAQISTGKHRDGRCQKDFCCKHPSHQTYDVKKHVLVCEHHKSSRMNQELLETFKQRCIVRRPNVPNYSKSISNYHSTYAFREESPSSSIEDTGIYQLQHIAIDSKSYLVFFDTGCSDFVVRSKAIPLLHNRATLQHEGPITLGGIGDVSTTSSNGIYSVTLPKYDGSDVTMTGVSLEKITLTFPEYPLDGSVIKDIHTAFTNTGGNPSTLPTLPSIIGGDVDFMVGIKYLRYHPQQVFQLPSGLTIYQSIFKSPDGSRGVIGGPHRIFSEINRSMSNGFSMRTFVANQLNLYKSGFQIKPDVPLLSLHRLKTTNHICVKDLDHFEELEKAGTEISYRCSKCRSCIDCKTNESIVATSIREEMEQELINKSLKVDQDQQLTIATLPFTHDPLKRLAPNRHKAMKIYNQQTKKLQRHPEDQQDVIMSERKLQMAGHVDFVKNLPPDIQHQLKTSLIQNYIPWRAVWKLSSITTPCRLVFDASSITDTGYSLNSILAKGTNGMNKLVEIFIRWFCHKIAFHTDVTKMYNAVKLRQDQWCYQRYLWNDTLGVNQPPEEKVIKTLIYGVKSSGNQAERGLRETVKLSKAKHPEVSEIINNDVLVDDCISGEESTMAANERADEMEVVLSKGGFSLKGFTFSNQDPPKHLTKDGKSIGVGGLTWYSKQDEVSLNVSELHFAKKQRGKKSTNQIGVIPERLTRRHCVSKVGELFDITGKVTPLTASFKLDLHDLVKLGLGWDDEIPNELRALWKSNFEMLQEIKYLRYSRTVIPIDAVNLKINTVDFGDASKSMAAITIYARLLRKNGEFSSQLIFGRSKIISVPTQPRAELEAALLNSHTGEIIKRSLKSNYDGSLKLTDSTIVLHWISNDEIQLKQYVRNRISDIRRFTSPDDWQYVQSKDMLADIATRRGTKVIDANNESKWINGHDWMKLPIDQFPTKSVNQISLNSNDLHDMKKETVFDNSHQEAFITKPKLTHQPLALPEVSKYYRISNYLIDPNKFRFSFVVRIMAHVLRFVDKIKQSVHIKQSTVRKKFIDSEHQKEVYHLTEIELQRAQTYFWKKATAEVKHFVKEHKYKQISTDINGVLTYTGRILPTDKVDIATPMTKIMKDLHETTFCVPVISKDSPLAYAIMTETHWYDKSIKHSGIEATLRYAMKKAYIIEGRDVAKQVKKACNFCRYMNKNKVQVVMGKIPSCCTTIAPAFFNTQTDLAGPFTAYSPHNKRKTMKIWLTIFCCTTTSTVSIKVMDDYSSTAFLMSFSRFACDNGYPKKMFVDQGSQIVKGCQNVLISFKDLQHRLHVDSSIDFELCPVGGHNFHGKVERQIRQVRASLNKSFNGRRLSLLQWETISSEIANSINDMPLSLNGITSNFETMDLLTPNRLKLGRNNDRSPVGSMKIARNLSKILASNVEIFNVWFDNWLINHVPKIIHQPKWFKQDTDIMINDIVLFLKNDSILCSTYQYGIIKDVSPGRDGRIRKVTVAYKNANESTFRTSSRAVRELVVIHQASEESLQENLYEAFEQSKLI